jgi:hypothetical protein
MQFGVDLTIMEKTPASATVKLGPGEYRPDLVFTRPEDLPSPKIIKQRRSYESLPCLHCRKPAPRDNVFTRQLHDLGDLGAGRLREVQITYSQHYCSACRKYFNADLSDVAPPYGHYTHRVMVVAIRLVVEDGLPYRSASWTLWRDQRVFVPFATLQNWVEAGGHRASARWETDYLAWALAGFSGYLAIDELYDGPFCVLSIVDNRTFKRLFYQVLDHDPTHDDMIAFFQRFQTVLQARQLTVRGITTEPITAFDLPRRGRAIISQEVMTMAITHEQLEELRQEVRVAAYEH